jgi:hypothetical protein
MGDNNSRSRHNHRANTSEGCHTNDASSVTSEGAHALIESLSPQLLRGRLLWHGHCPRVHCPGESPLFPAPIQCSHSPRKKKGNVIRGTCERPPPTTTFETRFWKRMRAPFPRDSRYSPHLPTSLWTEISLTAKYFAFTNHTRKKKNESG